MERMRRGASAAGGEGFEQQALRELPDTATSITRRVVRNEEIAELLKFVETLSDEDRRLVLYRGLEGLRHERVAQLMELSVDAVMQRWSRLRTRLQERGSLASFVAA